MFFVVAVLDRLNCCDYVDDLLSSGLIDGNPFVRAFVVGHRVNEKMQTIRTIGDPPRGKVCVTTYNQLVRTANRRLFRLREQLSGRYEELSTPDILRRKVLAEPYKCPCHPTMQVAMVPTRKLNLSL